MAKTKMKVAPAVETLKPYFDRALNDKDVRGDLNEAISSAKHAYGPLAKNVRKKGAVKSASLIATDAKLQENLRKALEDFGKAAGSLKGQKKKSHKKRNTVLLAGVAAGALYNPWSGPQTRSWLKDSIAGGDRLQPLGDDFAGAANGFASASTDTVNKATEAVTDAAAKVDKKKQVALPRARTRQKGIVLGPSAA
jgi:hypothetical protein